MNIVNLFKDILYLFLHSTIKLIFLKYYENSYDINRKKSFVYTFKISALIQFFKSYFPLLIIRITCPVTFLYKILYYIFIRIYG